MQLLTAATVDHPHGGGRGKSKSNRHPVTPWGKPVSGHGAAVEVLRMRKLTPPLIDQEWLQDSPHAQHQQLGGDAPAAQLWQETQQVVEGIEMAACSGESSVSGLSAMTLLMDTLVPCTSILWATLYHIPHQCHCILLYLLLSLRLGALDKKPSCRAFDKKKGP